MNALHSHGCNNKNKNVNNGENYSGLTNTMKKKKMCIPDMWISTLLAAFLTMAPMQHVVSMPAFALDSISSPAMEPVNSGKVNVTCNKNNNMGVIDKVWGLVEKYYIDQTFHGLDWESVKTEYKYRISPNTASAVDSNNNDEEQTKLSTQMV